MSPRAPPLPSRPPRLLPCHFLPGPPGRAVREAPVAAARALLLGALPRHPARQAGVPRHPQVGAPSLTPRYRPDSGKPAPPKVGTRPSGRWAGRAWPGLPGLLQRHGGLRAPGASRWADSTRSCRIPGLAPRVTPVLALASPQRTWASLHSGSHWPASRGGRMAKASDLTGIDFTDVHTEVQTCQVICQRSALGRTRADPRFG